MIKNMKQILTILTLILFFSIQVKSQEEKKANPLEEGNIKEQFDYAINKSSRYEEYRVIKIVWINKLRANILDSIQVLDSSIDLLKKESNQHQNSKDSIAEVLNSTNIKLDEAINNKNSMTFFGIQMKKSSYQNVTILIIVILIIAVVGMFFMFKRSNVITVETKVALKELHEEFDAHRKRALDREKTMARNHLNELNKLRNQ